MRPNLRWILFWVACLAIFVLEDARLIRADDAAVISEALKREIIGSRRTLEDVRAFVEERIPRMPELSTAEAWSREADRLRSEVLDRVILRGEARRWADAECRVEWLDAIGGGPGYRIRKLRYEALPGMWIPALLYEPENLDGKVPVVLNVNGHDAAGKAADYKQVRCINLAKRGMLALNVEWLGMGQLRQDGFQHGLINAIDLCGTSGIATHYLYLRRAIDLLLEHPNADQERVGVTGLSGGGWQTIFISPLDQRVTLCDPVAGYSSFLTRTRHASDLGDSEQTPCDLATVLDYAHLTAMLAPRPTLLTFNLRDNCCFAAPHALPPLVGAVAPVFSLFDREADLRFHVNVDPGDHNYGLDNRQALYRMLSDHWSRGGADYAREEFPSEDEVKTAEALFVPLPDGNRDLHRLALDLSDELPRHPEIPADLKDAGTWQAGRRAVLAQIVRPLVGGIQPEEPGNDVDTRDSITTAGVVLNLEAAWAIPAVEISRNEDHKGTALVIGDQGRENLSAEISTLLDRGFAVVAMDPFYLGEARVAERDYLWALMVGTVGQRPLGIQAGQVASVARWLAERKGEPVTVVAVGPRASTIALTAAALETEAVGAVELHRPLGTLKTLIQEGRVVNANPELFCFGLLEEFDIRQIAALVVPRPIVVIEPDESARIVFDGIASQNPL